MPTPTQNSIDRIAGEQALAEQQQQNGDEKVTHAILREGPRWRLTVVAIVLSFLMPPALTLGYISITEDNRQAACDAVEASNTELIRFLRPRVEDQQVVTELARVFDDVDKECRGS